MQNSSVLRKKAEIGEFFSIFCRFGGRFYVYIIVKIFLKKTNRSKAVCKTSVDGLAVPTGRAPI